MSIPLILFFSSLCSIIVMIGRKLLALDKGQVFEEVNTSFEVPFIKEVKDVTIHSIKKHGYAGLVTTLRWYFRGTNFVNNKYDNIKTKIENRKRARNENGEKKEISKFLKVIIEYKHKIRKIKHRIRNEESL